MTVLHFTKMQGAGNDYVYINGFEENVPSREKPALAVRLSDRHFGIGGDGVIFINPSAGADFEMEMYNADGTRGEMCGNGIRCVGKYVYDHGMTGTEPGGNGLHRRKFTVESFGVRHTLSIERLHDDGTAATLKVNMGAPVLAAEKIPVVPEDDMGKEAPVIDAPIAVAGKVWRMTCVSMGNPHAVVFTDDVDALDLPKIGPLFEHHARFPKRVNTEFIEALSKEEVRMRVWERGSGETLACGTGCCAAVVACVLNGKTGSRVRVDLRGGQLQIEWDREQNEIWMTGPAETAFEGTVRI